MKKNAKIVYLILGMIFILLPNRFASANAPMPPSEIWITFVWAEDQLAELDAIQLVGCQTEECREPVLLLQYGTCDADRCMRAIPLLESWPNTFDCVANLCRASAYYEGADGPFIKLIVQLQGSVIETNSIDLNLSPWGDAAVRVRVSNNGTWIEQDDDFSPPKLGYGNFWVGLWITLVSELLIGEMYLRLRLKFTTSMLTGKLLMVFLINLGTFPIVWLVFPALEYFQSIANRWASIFYLIIFSLYLVFLVAAFRVETKDEKKRVVAGGFVAIVVAFCLLGYTLFALTYGNYDVSTVGIPLTWILVLSELFAFTAEAFLLHFMDKATFSIWTAIELSVVMNSASVLAGLLVMRMTP